MRIPAILFALASVTVASASVTFDVSYTKSAFDGEFTGRVIVFLTQRGGEPRTGPNWFSPEPFYSTVVKGLKPGDSAKVTDGNATGFPGRLSALKPGKYTVQAVFDRNLGGRQAGDSPGNPYSMPKPVEIAADGTVSIQCDQTVAEPKFVETESTKEVKVTSSLLSKFYGRPTQVKAAVILPPEYVSEPNRKFPIIYEIPGFGGTHYGLSGNTRTSRTQRGGEAFIYVLLNPDCPTGHCVFADSANNGPWGAALTKELIPAIETKYRTYNQTGARYVTGHSSGGWSSMWLQVTYPEVFGGVWSTSPDPVDFRDFQRINLYNSKSNMFTDEEGKPRPLARSGATPIVFYKPFSDMERPLGRGEQLGSFDGVFSPRAKNGQPMELWNRDTGAIDPKVVEAWKKYDIGLTLRTNYKTLAPKLAGKIHLYMGDMDTFYLEGATKLLQKDMKALGSDAVIEIVPGDHGSMMTPALRQRIGEEMAAQFAKFKAK